MEWILAFEFTGMMGILLYWLPASLCFYGYTVRTWLNYQKDVKERERDTQAKPTCSSYCPTDTVGTLVGRGLVTVCPVANLWAASFDIAPKLFATFFDWVGKVFNTPLVPRRRN